MTKLPLFTITVLSFVFLSSTSSNVWSQSDPIGGVDQSEVGFEKIEPIFEVDDLGSDFDEIDLSDSDFEELTQEEVELIIAQEEGLDVKSLQDLEGFDRIVSEDNDGEEVNISLDFRDADIKNVLKILAIKSGINIVTSPEVEGNISIELADVPWEEALTVILQTYGYAYERRGNIIIVSTVEDIQRRRQESLILEEQEKVATKTFTLNFAKAEEVLTSLEKIVSERGSVDFDQRTNIVIVTEAESKMPHVEELIGDLDRTTPQILIEGKLVETTFSDTDNLGINWVTEATLTPANGYQHSWPYGTPVDNNANLTFGTLDFNQTQAVFEALRTKTHTNILSSPRVVTLDNQPAEINVGSQYPIPSYVFDDETGDLQVSGFEYKDIGILFRVTPQANKAGFIVMDVEPQVTAIIDDVVVENTTLPVLSNESVQTRVMVKSGETLVIAGLVRTRTQDTKTTTPFLSDIPLLGKAFRKSDKTVNKTDLMIFLTPHIITPDVD